jgi:hypothetical protein
MAVGFVEFCNISKFHCLFVQKSTPRITDADGRVVSGGGGYLYFGAARDLPGVRELLEKKDGTLIR